MKDYKKILEGVVNIINNTEKSDIGFANLCAYIGENCPELKKSDDERIREALIEHFRWNSKQILNEFSNKKALAWLEKQKPAEWSEEDERKLAESIALIRSNNTGTFYYEKDELSSFLKSLKDRVGCEVNCTTKKEWSEEDEDNRINAIKYLELFDAQGIHGNVATPCINWLKSLKDRYTWKPSDEQMERLKGIINSLPHQKVLYSLYQDLLKLKG